MRIEAECADWVSAEVERLIKLGVPLWQAVEKAVTETLSVTTSRKRGTSHD